MVHDVMMAWEQNERDRAAGRPPQVAEEDLLKLLNSTR
jgi:hypothetical protein